MSMSTQPRFLRLSRTLFDHHHVPQKWQKPAKQSPFQPVIKISDLEYLGYQPSINQYFDQDQQDQLQKILQDLINERSTTIIPLSIS